MRGARKMGAEMLYDTVGLLRDWEREDFRLDFVLELAFRAVSDGRLDLYCAVVRFGWTKYKSSADRTITKSLRIYQ